MRRADGPPPGAARRCGRTCGWSRRSRSRSRSCCSPAPTRSIGPPTTARFTLPNFVISGTPDAARQILTAIAAAVITVVTLVFSITIVTLTLASTQFGPRMLRNFIRDRITQVTLGSFVATFVYAILALVAIGSGSHGGLVPHLSITVTMALVVADVVVLVVLHRPHRQVDPAAQVIASIAGDLSRAIEAEAAIPQLRRAEGGPSPDEMLDAPAGGERPGPRPRQRLPAVRQHRAR